MKGQHKLSLSFFRCNYILNYFLRNVIILLSLTKILSRSRINKGFLIVIKDLSTVKNARRKVNVQYFIDCRVIDQLYVFMNIYLLNRNINQNYRLIVFKKQMKSK